MKAALDAAGQAMARVLGYADENTCDAAAAAIAAFHRAVEQDARSVGLIFTAQTHAGIAAAVERAAGGGDE